MRKPIAAIGAVVIVSCSVTAPGPVSTPAAATQPTQASPAAELIDAEGTSTQTAVAVPAAAPNEGIDFEKNWIFDHYGRFRVEKWGIAHEGEGSAERRYKVMTVELADHTTRTVYFDITENWKSWRPAETLAQPHL